MIFHYHTLLSKQKLLLYDCKIGELILNLLIYCTPILGPDNSLSEHSWKAHSMSPVNLAEIQNLEASVYDLSVIQIHGKIP